MALEKTLRDIGAGATPSAESSEAASRRRG
jgi:hypothetical protein